MNDTQHLSPMEFLKKYPSFKAFKIDELIEHIIKGAGDSGIEVSRKGDVEPILCTPGKFTAILHGAGVETFIFKTDSGKYKCRKLSATVVAHQHPISGLKELEIGR